MSQTIDIAFVTAFNDNVFHLSQQMESRLRNAVTVKPVVGESCNFERLGKAAFTQKLTRHSATPQADIPHTRRRANMATWGQGETIDKDDEVRALITPQSEYLISLVAAGKRDFDEKVILAMNGSAAEGHDGTTLTALPAAQKIAHGGAQLTLAKVIEARTILSKAQVGTRDRYLIVGSQQIKDILTESGESRITSSDYNNTKPLVEGGIMWFLGFNWIEVDDSLLPIDPLDSNPTTGSRLIYAWNKRGVGVGIAKDLTPEIGIDTSLRFATRIYLEHVLGAVRIEDESVVQISCSLD